MKPDKTATITKWIVGLIFTVIIVSIPVKSHTAFPGDCNGDLTVSIAEVQSAINMFLGIVLPPYPACVDTNGIGNVSIAEVQSTINSFLGIQQDPVEAVRVKLAEIIDTDPKMVASTRLTPEEYALLANRFAAVSGVESAVYANDTLGTFYVTLQGGGTLEWRHITSDFLVEAGTLPKTADFSKMVQPDWNNTGWSFSQYATLPKEVALQVDQSNTYASHFPVATSNPDLDYKADDAVVCPTEGKIAIVDFLWTEAHETSTLYESQFVADGVKLYDKSGSGRIQQMARAAGFETVLFTDTDINLGNLSVLSEYKIVMMVGHGGRPGKISSGNAGQLVSLLHTPEIYVPEKKTEGGLTYEEAFKKGYIAFNIKTKKIAWTSLLFKDFYKPAPNQMVMLNQCWAMLPFNAGLYPNDSGGYAWKENLTGPVYNLGQGLMDAGTKVVFGYITPATPAAVVHNTMTFFRRLFGGHFADDTPPASFLLSYWPTCMSAQTYFRKPWSPGVAEYAPKYRDQSLYTMYAVSQSQYFRETCSTTPTSHTKMREFVLTVGTPATAFGICWDNYWSKGVSPSGLVDPLCSQGDKVTSELATQKAACAVKQARKVTNAILAQ